MGIYENARLQTKNRIKSTFWEAYKIMPLSKITVRYLSEACHIHRSTFYFHYQDVYAILEEIEAELLDKLSIFERKVIDDNMSLEIFSQLLEEVFQNDLDYLKYLVHQRRDFEFSETYGDVIKRQLLNLLSHSSQAIPSMKEAYLIDLSLNAIIFTLIQGLTDQTLTQAELHKLISGLSLKGIQTTLQEDFDIQF